MSTSTARHLGPHPARAVGGLFAALGVLIAALLVAPATPAAAAPADATFQKSSDWGTGYQATYTIHNTSTTQMNGWRLEFDLPSNVTLGSFWDAQMTSADGHVTAVNREYNAVVPAGGQVSFGFVVGYTGTPTDPANCLLNGDTCVGSGDGGDGGGDGGGGDGGDPGDGGGSDPLGSDFRFAPYIDMGAFPTPDLPTVSADSGVRDFTLAFVTAVGCHASWFNAFDPRDRAFGDQIDRLRAMGGDVKVSFGGAAGIELAQACGSVSALTAEYQAVIDAYNLDYVDFDIEGAAQAEPVSVQRRSLAMAQLQAANPTLRIALTLPVLPSGLVDGVNVVRSARDAGVDLDAVNVMAMDYNQGTDKDMGQAAIDAAISTHDQLADLLPDRSDTELWSMIGVTPMLGENDDGSTFTQADARELVDFASQRNITTLSYWELTRDRNACTGALFRCTNMPQRSYEFAGIFEGFTG